MKKSLLLALIIGWILLVGIGNTFASQSFSSLVDFSGSGTTTDGRTYLELSGKGTLSTLGIYTYSYTHDVTFDPAALSIESAALTLTHKGNSDNLIGELWLLGATSTGTSSFYVGKLSNSTHCNDWVDDVFTLPGSIYSEITGSSWTLMLVLAELTPGTDKLLIDQSVLSGTYTPQSSTQPPVPIPAAVWLFGTGLVGLVGIRRRFTE